MKRQVRPVGGLSFLEHMEIDSELIEQCIERKQRAQHTLYKKCYGIVMGTCFRYADQKVDAESLLNLAFCKILMNLEKYSSEVPFEAWIRRITINTIIDEFRKQKRYKETHTYPDEIFSDGHIDMNTADAHFQAEELKKLILRLPPVSQKVFNLYVIDGYKHAEISEMLKISEGTSKWHVSHARKMLKKMIVEELKDIRVD